MKNPERLMRQLYSAPRNPEVEQRKKRFDRAQFRLKKILMVTVRLSLI